VECGTQRVEVELRERDVEPCEERAVAEAPVRRALLDGLGDGEVEPRERADAVLLRQARRDAAQAREHVGDRRGRRPVERPPKRSVRRGYARAASNRLATSGQSTTFHQAAR